MTPGEKLARARKRNGFKSQNAFANHVTLQGLPLTKDRLARIEQGKVKNLTLNEIIAIAQAMPQGMSLDWWLKSEKASADVIFRKTAKLNREKRAIVLQLIDGLNAI